MAIPHIPIDPVPAPTSTDLTNPENTFPLLDPIVSPESVGPQVANRQPEALDRRTDTLLALVAQLIDVVNVLDAELLHRDGATVGTYMRGDLDMQDVSVTPAVKRRVVGVADGVNPTDVVNKGQLDTLLASVNTLVGVAALYLKRDGSTPMQADLSLGNFRAIAVKDPVLATDLATKGYVDAKLNPLQTGYLPRDGSLAMAGTLNMGFNSIVGVSMQTPAEPGSVVNLEYLNALAKNLSRIAPGTLVWYAGSLSTPLNPFVPSTTSGTQPPAGWLFADGSLVSKTVYQDLFNSIGHAFAKGGDDTTPGSTTFRLPDLRGRVVVGLDQPQGGIAPTGYANVITSATDPNLGRVLGGLFGSELITLATSQLPAHNHTFTDFYMATGAAGAFTGPSSTASANTPVSATNTTQQAGGGQGHPNVQPSISLMAIIKH